MASRASAEAQAVEFFERVRARVRTMSPRILGQIVARILGAVKDGHMEMRYWPPHYLLHALEASCAHFREPYSKEISQDDLLKLMKVYVDYYDPISNYLLTDQQRLDLMLVAYSRAQFPVQGRVDLHFFGRTASLFDPARLPRCDRILRQRLGFSIRDWQRFCLAVMSSAADESRGHVLGEGYLDSLPDDVFPRSVRRSMFRSLSRSPEEVGAGFMERRSKRLFHDILIPTQFRERPLLEIRPQVHVVVSPDWVAERCGEGVRELLDGLDHATLSNELGASFESYVEKTIREAPGVIRVIPERELRSAASGRICDFLVETQEAILLVECKVGRQSVIEVSEEAVYQTDTRRLADATNQLAETAISLQDAEVRRAINLELWARPILPMVITSDPFYGANGRRYRELLDRRLGEMRRQPWNRSVAPYPEILPVADFELLVVAARRADLGRLVLDKQAAADDVLGDWHPFLGQKVQEGECIERLADEGNQFFRDLLDRAAPGAGLGERIVRRSVRGH